MVQPSVRPTNTARMSMAAPQPTQQSYFKPNPYAQDPRISSPTHPVQMNQNANMYPQQQQQPQYQQPPPQQQYYQQQQQYHQPHYPSQHQHQQFQPRHSTLPITSSLPPGAMQPLPPTQTQQLYPSHPLTPPASGPMAAGMQMQQGQYNPYSPTTAMNGGGYGFYPQTQQTHAGGWGR